MKKWVHASTDDLKVIESSDKSKLKRTLESGHSYDTENTFETIEDYLKWWEDDELYED